MPVTALKLAQFAAYNQVAVSFDWAIDSARDKIGDRTERDYRIKAAPVVEAGVKVELADAPPAADEVAQHNSDEAGPGQRVQDEPMEAAEQEDVQPEEERARR